VETAGVAKRTAHGKGGAQANLGTATANNQYSPAQNVVEQNDKR